MERNKMWYNIEEIFFVRRDENEKENENTGFIA